MKKHKLSASEQFAESMKNGLAKYYSDAISENIKRAIKQRRERLQSTKVNN